MQELSAGARLDRALRWDEAPGHAVGHISVEGHCELPGCSSLHVAS